MAVEREKPVREGTMEGRLPSPAESIDDQSKIKNKGADMLRRETEGRMGVNRAARTAESVTPGCHSRLLELQKGDLRSS